MTALFPTRVSIYDFLIEDTNPIAPLLADSGNISIPQAKLIIVHGIQAITSALLAYNQTQGGEAVLKKLLNRSQVKELRKYNAFNFKTMKTAIQYGQPVSDVLFQDLKTQKTICQHIAFLSAVPSSTVKPILASLTLLCLRELAVLIDFAQLDVTEIEEWLKQQPQFLELSRSGVLDKQTSYDYLDYNPKPNQDTILAIPEFEPLWHDFTGFHYIKSIQKNTHDSMPHYAKVIGRSSQTSHSVAPNSNPKQHQTALIPNMASTVIDTANKSDILTFSTLTHISLPYQRWLLQLAKISDIYLSRKRLKIAPEPKQAPNRPLVSFGFMEELTRATASEQPILYDDPTPFWRNPVLIIIFAIIGVLSLLAIGKFQYKKYNNTQPLPDIVEVPNTNNLPAKDIAIVQIDEQI